jgi:predicted anti-sigma-YlaC factor YlaD
MRMDCEKVLEQLSEFLDENAREELCRTIEAHLSQCRDCRVYVDSVRKTIILYQNDNAIELPVGANTRLEEAMAREYRSRPESSSD